MSACPFELCTANVIMVTEQAQAGDDELTVQRVPMHEIEGEFARFGRCPASLLRVPLDEYGEASLAVQAGTLRRIVRTAQARKQAPNTPEPQAPERPDDRWFRHKGGGDPRVTGPAGYRRLTRPPMGVVGPRSDASTNPQPITSQEGESSSMSDSLREQFRALTELAIQGFGQGQDLCASLTDAIEKLDSVVVALVEKQQQAHTLALRAVGDSANVPQAAANMIGSSDAAGSTIGDIEAALQLALLRVAACHQSLGAAAAQGEQYLAII